MAKGFYAGAASHGQMPLLMPTSSWTPIAELPIIRGKGFKRIALDIETKDPELSTKGPGFRRDAKVIGLAVGVQDTGQKFYLPVGHQGGGNLDENLVRRWAKEELDDYDGEVVGTNLGYDLDGLAEWGLSFKSVKAFHDVQIAEPLIDEWRDEFNLDALSKSYLGEGKDEDLLKEAAAAFGITGRDNIKRNLWRYPANMVGPYAEGDVDRPLRIFPLQEKRLREEELWPLYDGVERRLIPLLVRMRRRGVRISVQKAEELRARMKIELYDLTARLKLLAGPSAEFSEAETLWRSLSARGIHVPLTKKTQVHSVTKPFLERYQDDELVGVILQGRKIATVINTFIDGQILGHSIHGRIHPTFNQLKGDGGGTIARFSGSNPNLQFIPARDGELAPLVRGIFLPEEGEEWQCNDLSQIQFRMLTDCAVGQGAEEARRRYQEEPKTDFHKMTAEMLGADPEDKVRRKRVKNTNFAKVFGAQVPKLATTFGCSVEEAQLFMNEYEAKLPWVKDTFDAAARWAQRRGFVVTVLNRRQRFQDWGPKGFKRGDYGIPIFKSREEAHEYWITEGERHLFKGRRVYGVERLGTFMALNRKMQGSEGDLMKKWMADADEAGLTADGALGPFLMTVHDELGSSLPKTQAGYEAGDELVRLGEAAIKIRVPVLVGCVRAEDWGKCL